MGSKQQRILAFAFSWLFLVLLMGAAYSYDIGRFISEENHFLKEDEVFEQPSAKITAADGKAYWIVPLVSGDVVKTYIPLRADKAEFSTLRTTNRNLFRAADILRSYLLNKKSVSENPAADWFVTNANARVTGNLANFLADETYQLNSIDSTMNDAAASAQVSSLNAMLGSMSTKALQLREGMLAVLDVESKFNTEATADEIASLQGLFGEVFTTMDALDSEALQYRSELDKLKQMISVSELGVDDKGAMLALAEPPAEFSNIGKWALDSDNLKSIIDSIYSQASARLDSMLDEFESRLEMSQTYAMLYSQNDELLRLDSSFTSLAVAAGAILSANNKPLWKNQEMVAKLESDWKSAKDNYARERYALARQYAQKAVDDAKAVYRGGFAPAEQQQLLTTELILRIVAVLVALLVLLYLIQKRGRILAAFRGQKEEEVKVYEWQK